MEKTSEQLECMLKKQAEPERFNFSEDALKEESSSFIDQIRKLIKHELLITAVDAQKQADSYWESNTSARESGSMDERCFVGTRVRIIRESLHMEWFRLYNAEDRTFTNYLKKGKESRYKDAYFKKEPKWAREAIKDVEDRYELLRKRAAVLTALRRNLREYEKLINTCFPDKSIDN